MPLLQTEKLVATLQSAAALHDAPPAREEAAQAEQEQAETAAPAAGAAVAAPAAVEQEAPAAAAEAPAGAASGSRQKGGKRASKTATGKGGSKTAASKGLPASSAAERGTDHFASAEPGEHKGEPAGHAAPAAAVNGQAEAGRPAKRVTSKIGRNGPNKKTGAAKSRKSIEPAVDEVATAAVQGQDGAAVPAAAGAADAVEQQSEAVAGSEPGAGKPEVRTAIDLSICFVPPAAEGSAGEATVHCYVIHTMVECC